MKTVEIYTDGACSNNPGEGGWGVVLIYKTIEKYMSGYEGETTNNAMELTAAIKGLEALNEPCEVILYSDSAYLINGFNLGWIYKWKKLGWKRTPKDELKNKELWIRLYELNQVHKIRFVKVKGHADNKYNNLCDQMAVKAVSDKKGI
ncbi:MAG TPA: ribonuclease HI [Clostridiales bacterium]|nr:ribonuclease HI [Clostridiales bacterium]